MKKGKIDVKRGKIFIKIGKEIVVVVKNGGLSLDINVRLRDIIVKVKVVNMFNDIILKVIKKVFGELLVVNYENIVYEGYGFSGVVVIVEIFIDNKNRLVGNVRSVFIKGGGNMGILGCVLFMF